MDLEQVTFAAALLKANIPAYLIEEYAGRYCAKFKLQLRKHLPLERPQQENKPALRFSTDTIEYLRGTHIVEK